MYVKDTLSLPPKQWLSVFGAQLILERWNEGNMNWVGWSSKQDEISILQQQKSKKKSREFNISMVLQDEMERLGDLHSYDRKRFVSFNYPVLKVLL